MICHIDSDQIWETPRRIYYRVIDDFGNVHTYGPIMTSDPNFNAEAYKIKVLENIQAKLAAGN